MTWANLGILGVGAALISVPIILHFLMQPKPKQLMFPAMRFLKEIQQANRSKMRIRHLLLLLMRCLLIGLLAIALAGPSVASNEFGNWLTLGGIGFSGLVVAAVLSLAFFRGAKKWLLIGILAVLFLGHVVYGGWAATKLLTYESAQLIGDDQAPVAALIVIDTSPRMEYLFKNQTRLERAQEMGAWLVSQFPVDSQVCVMATDGDRPFFSVDVSAAERRIETLQVDFSGNSIPSALDEGLKILNQAPQERKEIYVITDFTLASWAGGNPKPLLRKLDQDPATALFVIDVGIESPTNFSLSQLVLSDAEIAPDGRLAINTELRRIGGAAQRTIRMTVERHEPPKPVVRDGRSIFPEATFGSQTAIKDIRENSSMPVKFTFNQPLDFGTYHGKVEIEGQDALTIDNQRFFTVRVGRMKKIMIVHPENVDPRIIPSLLTPQASKYEWELVKQNDFVAYDDFAGYDALFLLDPKPIGDDVWGRLERFADDGGGVGIFPGYNAANGSLADASFTTPAAVRVLSGRLEQQWFNDTFDLYLSPGELTHPIFNWIRSSPESVLWNKFSIQIHWGIEPDENGEELPTQTLLRFGNREPAVIERTLGAGRVLIMTTPITEYGNVQGRPSWNRLLTGSPVPMFLLLRGIASYLVQSDTDSLNILVGQTASFDNDLRQFPERYDQVFSPDPERPPTAVNTVNGKIRYRFTDYPGHYRMKGLFNESELVLRGFSANLDEAATDLTRIEPDQLDSFLGPERYQVATQENEIQRQQGTTRRGQEFYPIVALMMLVVMAVEYLMSNRFYKS